MSNSYVGAGILNIITESLYDNPIVVFREYVQNSMDSILKEENQENREIKIWYKNDNLFFLDNGRGVGTDVFLSEMRKIGGSTKKKQKNLGYKGIGRLSGVPYCKKLYFINIVDYINGNLQVYTIDSIRYDEIKNSAEDANLSFEELMDRIGEYKDNTNFDEYNMVLSEIEKYKDVLEITNTGFLVILNSISPVLCNTINAKEFFTNLQWLLPVDFDNSLYDSEANELFSDLTNKKEAGHNSLIKYCKISYNDIPIYRPIKKEMFRDYICKNNFKYAVGFHSFKGDKIYIDQSNLFTGIRIYIDNMLLCDENELLQNLDNYGLLSHTLNGQLQSVRGIGAMIYITDKVNISANARRTFIEVTDNYSLDFLRLLAEFVNTIYDTRYALSNYVSAKLKQNHNNEKLEKAKQNALDNLRKLAKEDIELTVEEEPSFEELSVTEKKRAIKHKIVNNIDKKIKEYLNDLSVFDIENAYNVFIEWLHKNT